MFGFDLIDFWVRQEGWVPSLDTWVASGGKGVCRGRMSHRPLATAQHGLLRTRIPVEFDLLARRQRGCSWQGNGSPLRIAHGMGGLYPCTRSFLMAILIPSDSNALVLPVSPLRQPRCCPEADGDCAARVRAWLRDRAGMIRKAWSRDHEARDEAFLAGKTDRAAGLCEVLASRRFNFQTRVKVNPLLPRVRNNIEQQLASGGPLVFYLLYNGGYRASPWVSDPSLVFEPDQTEMMLLRQVALLREETSRWNGLGMEFHIVLNNGVASWVNDVPIEATERYARQLRRMVEGMGAGGTVRVLVQSELPGYEARPAFEPVDPAPVVSEGEHRLVERFLGRRCSREEASRRTLLYAQSEKRWAEDLSRLVAARGGLMLRQVAHPDMLSFRPFPGGAIRVQNGSLGFQVRGNDLLPKLVTTESARQHGVMWVPWVGPWSDEDCLR